MHAHADIPALMAQCQSLPLANFEPRRSLHMANWQDKWDECLAILSAWVQDPACTQTASEVDANILQETCVQWENASHTASTLLRLALDRGAPPEPLRVLYVQVVAVWRAYAHVLQHAHQAGCAAKSHAIRPETVEYQFALQLLCLAVLLDEEGEIPSIVEELLCGKTDRLLDYLSAAAMDLEEASDDYWHTLPFEGLNDFLDQYGQVLPDPLLPYLDQHYSRFFALPLAEQKHHPRLQGTHAGSWWALEVAALVVLYELDDKALRAHPHYPADLVDDAKGVRGAWHS